MSTNIITHIKSDSVIKIMDVISRDMNLSELKIDNYEEFFHALVHIKPKLFIVEITDLNDPYVKIIDIVKKSILTRNVPIIVIVNSNEESLIEQITKHDIQAIIYSPINKETLSLYIRNLLKSLKYKENVQMIQDLRTVQSVMISGLASLAEYRDPETGEHIKRTQNYLKALATTLRKKGMFLEELTLENIEAMYMSVPLHDIGKVGIRDEILLKPDKLDDEEFEIMKKHAKIGYDTIKNVGNKLKNSAFLEYAAEVAYTHHEKYDGSGYPRGLKGDEIPLIGRLMAVADVYDALTSNRVYKKAMPHSEAMKIIKNGMGTHFDPVIVECALSLERTFRNIAATYKDFDNASEKHLHLADLVNNHQIGRVLVVEDSRIVREITRNQLTAFGLDVDVANDGADAYNKIKNHYYDLVLLDIEMPIMNGYDLARKLRNENINTIIIAMTAADYNVTNSKLKKYDISGLILKPIDFNKLATLYSEALKTKNNYNKEE